MKILTILSAALASLVFAATAGASRAPSIYCVGGKTVTSDSYVLAFEAGNYGSGFVSTDEGGPGGYWFADEDSDDVAVTLGACKPAAVLLSGPDHPHICAPASVGDTNPVDVNSLPTDYLDWGHATPMINSGGWVLAAVVPGTYSGADNVPAYGGQASTSRFVCDPASNLKPTGLYVRQSGQVVDKTTAGYDAAGAGIWIDYAQMS
jgi:hypothetical protein